MTSLFDIAAGLSQYADTEGRVPGSQSVGGGHRSSNQSQNQVDDDVNSMSALSLLDETLRTIHDARQLPQLGRARSLTLLPVEQSDTIHTNKKGMRPPPPAESPRAMTDRMNKLLAAKIPPPPLPTVYARSLSQITASTKPDNQHSLADGVIDPDMRAKTILREITDEMEQLPPLDGTSQVQAKRAQFLRYLTVKYVENQLNKLANTPFVLLARRKAMQKIEQVQVHVPATQKEAPTATVPPTKSQMLPPDKQATSTANTLWARLNALTSDQQVMLQRLATISATQRAQLSKTQKELWEFAQRYQKITALSEQDLQKFPLAQQQIIRRMQKTAASSKEQPTQQR